MPTSTPSLEQKLDHARELLRELGSVLVCFSGGIDSTLVLSLAERTLGERAMGLTAVSPMLLVSLLRLAKQKQKESKKKEVR